MQTELPAATSEQVLLTSFEGVRFGPGYDAAFVGDIDGYGVEAVFHGG